MKRFLIFVFILLTCSMFGQVKLRQLERDSIKFSVPTPKDQIIIAGDTSYSQRYIPGLAWLDSLGVSGVQDYYISNDTLYLTTTDSTYAVIVPTSEDIRVDTAYEGVNLGFFSSSGITIKMTNGQEFLLDFSGVLDLFLNDIGTDLSDRNMLFAYFLQWDNMFGGYNPVTVEYRIRPKIFIQETEPIDAGSYNDRLYPGYVWKKLSTGEVFQLSETMTWVLISDLVPNEVDLDLDPNNEYILEDNIIVNGYMTRDDNLNFSEFTRFDNAFVPNTFDYTKSGVNYLIDQSFSPYAVGSIYAFDLFIDEDYIFVLNSLSQIQVYSWDNVDISSAVYLHTVTSVLTQSVFCTENYLYGSAGTGTINKYLKSEIISNGPTFNLIEGISIGSFPTRDFSILNDKFLIRDPSSNNVYFYQFTDPDSLATAVPYDTLDFSTTGKAGYNGGIDWLNDSLFIYQNTIADSIWTFDNNLNLISSNYITDQPFGIHIKDGVLYIGEASGVRTIRKYNGVISDTVYVDDYEVLDSNNYYKLSADVYSTSNNTISFGLEDENGVTVLNAASADAFTGWKRLSGFFKPNSVIKARPFLIGSNLDSIKNVRLFLKQYVDYDLDLDPTNELYDDTDIHNRVDSVSNAILWEDMGTYIRDKQSTKVSVSDGGRLGIGVAIPTATLQIESTDSNPLLITKSGGNLTYLNTQGEQNWLMALGGPGRVAIQRYSSRPAISFYDGAGYSSNNFSMYHTATAFNMGYAATGIDALVIYDDDDVRIGNELRVVGKAQISDLTPTATQLIGADGTKYLGSVGISSDLQLSSSVLGLKNSRPVYRTYHHMEGQTLRPWWADAEDSWYLADERYESVTNSCGLNSAGFFNMGDDYGQFITDSCVISVVYSNTGNGITYADGYMYFVPYASQLTMGADSVKVRTRDRDDIWTTPVPKQAVNIVDADGDYGWIYVNAPVYVREFEITYYSTSFQIAELEYFYIRSNNDIPMVRKNANNVFYRNNTFLGGIGDQYYSFGTTNQILRSDGTNIFWDDETIYDYEFDSTGIYNYVNSLQESNVEFYYDTLDGVDILDFNEYILEDNYIENGNQTRDDNFNFPEFHNTERGFFANITGPTDDYDRVAYYGRLYEFPTWNSIALNENYIFRTYNDNIGVYTWDGYDIKSGVYLGRTDNRPFSNSADFNLFIDENYLYKVVDDKLIYYDIDTIVQYAIDEAVSSLKYEGFHQLLADYDYPTEISIYDGVLYMAQNNGYIYRERIGVEILDTLDFTGFGLNFYTVEAINDNLLLIGGLAIPTAYYVDTLGTVIKSHTIAEGMRGSHVYNNDLFYARHNNYYGYQYIYIGRDTVFTTIPEILDTSNYYSYSIEIEGNNVDTIRTGIATWLNGNVSYQWCTGDTLYTGWYRHELDFKATEHDSIKPVFVIADTTSIRNVRLFLQQFQAENFDDTAIQERIDSVITVIEEHKDIDLDIDPTNEIDSFYTDGIWRFNGDTIPYINALDFNTGNGILTIDMIGQTDVFEDLDGRYQTGDEIYVSSGSVSGTDILLPRVNASTITIDASAFLQAEVDGNTTNEGLMTFSTVSANSIYQYTSNTSGSDFLRLSEDYNAAGDNRIIQLTNIGNAVQFNLKNAEIIESLTPISSDLLLVWDESVNEWKASTISNLPGDGNNYPTSFGWSTSTGLLTLNRSGLSNITIDLDGRYLQSEVDGSTTNEIQQQSVANISGNYYLGNTSQSGNGIRLIGSGGITISGTTGTSGTITIDGSDIVGGESTTVGTGLSLAGYQVNPDFDAFTQDNTFSGTDEVVYLSFTTHKRGTLAGLGAYMQANWGDGTGTDDQAIYYYLSGSTPALRLDGTSTGMEFDAGEGLVSSGFEEGTLDRILYQHDWTEFNVLSSGVTTSDYLLVLDGTDEARMQISYLATLIGGADGNGLWNSSNSNTTMASGMEPRVNNYLLFESATEAPLFYIDDAATDFMAFKGTTALPHPVFGSADVSVHGTFGSSNDIFSQDDIRAGGDVIAGGWGVFGGFVSVGDLTEGPATGLVGYGSGNHLTNEITIGDNLEFTGSRLNVLTDAEEFYGADPTPSASDVNITMSGTRVSSGAGAGAVSGGNIVVATGLYLVTVSFYAEQGQGIVAVNTFTGSTSGQWPSVYYDVGSSKVSCSQSALVDVTASGTLTYEVDAISGTNEISQFEIIFIKLSD